MSLAACLPQGCRAGYLVCGLLVGGFAHRVRRRPARCGDLGSGEHGVRPPGRCPFMDLFYCGSNQSLGAMVFPLTQVAPFSPISISSFGMDGGGRRVVRVASAEESKDLVVIFSISKVFCVSLAGQLSSLYFSRRCLYLHSCVYAVLL